jgi:hypothetical protein
LASSPCDKNTALVAGTSIGVGDCFFSYPLGAG